MDRGPTAGWLIGAALGITVAAVPFLFPHVPRLVAAALFDAGAIMLFVSLASYLSDTAARP